MRSAERILTGTLLTLRSLTARFYKIRYHYEFTYMRMMLTTVCWDRRVETLHLVAALQMHLGLTQAPDSNYLHLICSLPFDYEDCQLQRQCNQLLVVS